MERAAPAVPCSSRPQLSGQAERSEIDSKVLALVLDSVEPSPGRSTHCVTLGQVPKCLCASAITCKMETCLPGGILEDYGTEKPAEQCGALSKPLSVQATS